MQLPIASINPAEARSGRIVFSTSARSAIVAACRGGGRQAVLLSWPAGATYLPRECYRQGEFDAVVGHVAGCPIYADVRRLALYADRRVMLDAERNSRGRPHPPLRARVLPSPGGDDEEPRRRETPFEVAAARVARAVARDLDDQFAGAYPLAAILACVRAAIADLRGSVSVEALPEMAARLAHHRLSRGVPTTVS